MLVDRLVGGVVLKAWCGFEVAVGEMGLRNGLLAAVNALGEVASAKEDESEPRRGMPTETGVGLLLLEEEGMSMGPPKSLLLCAMVYLCLGEGVFWFFGCVLRGQGKGWRGERRKKSFLGMFIASLPFCSERWPVVSFSTCNRANGGRSGALQEGTRRSGDECWIQRDAIIMRPWVRVCVLAMIAV